jgi:hypothetical protein
LREKPARRCKKRILQLPYSYFIVLDAAGNRWQGRRMLPPSALFGTAREAANALAAGTAGRTFAALLRSAGFRDRAGAVQVLRWLLAAVSLGAGLSVAVRSLRMVALNCQKVPYWDQWEEVGGDNSWFSLVAQHNEHRILFPRLIFMADRVFAQESNLINYAANVAIQLATAGLILHLARLSGLRDLAGRVWAAGMGLALLLWAGQYENFLWGFQVQFFGVLLAAAAAFSVLALRRPGAVTVALTIAIETVAVYTLSSGMLVPFLAIGLALLLGRSRWAIISLTVAALLLLGSYLLGYTTPSIHSDPLDAYRHLPGILSYVVVELGGPVSQALYSTPRLVVAGVAGAAGLTGFLWLAWRMLRSPGAVPPAQLALLALAGFVAGMCMITATGRLRFGFEQALASRYATPVLVFWISVIALFAARVRSGGRTSVAVLAASLPLVLLMAASEGKTIRTGTLWSQQRKAAIPALLANVPDNRLLSALYGDPALILRKSMRLREAGLSVFADARAGWLGTPMSAHVTATGDAQCKGSFNRGTLLPEAAAPQAWRATGQVESASGAAPPERLLLVDGDGLVVGYGIGGLDLAALGLAGSTGQAAATGWIGEYRQDNPASVSAYALIGTAACRLGPPAMVVRPRTVVVSGSHPAGLSTSGYVDTVSFAADKVRLSGWGLLQPGDAGRLLIDTNLPVAAWHLESVARPDVVLAMHDGRLDESGFVVGLDLVPGVALPARVRLCLWTEDRDLGRHLLANPAGSSDCSASE